MRNRTSLFVHVLAVGVALAACTPATSANDSVPAGENTSAAAPVSQQSAAPTPGATAADPAASQVDFAALAGRWRVAGVAPGDGVQALAKDDPAYMGRVVVIGPERLAWADGPADPAATVGDRCEGPVTQRLTGAAATAVDTQLATQLKALGAAGANPYAIECDTGNWGPEAAGGATLYRIAPDALALSWYDGIVLKLVRAGA